jgi:hypothetical protein
MIKKKSKDRKNVRVGAGAGALVWIYGSAEPEPKVIFTAPQDWKMIINHHGPRSDICHLPDPPPPP